MSARLIAFISAFAYSAPENPFFRKQQCSRVGKNQAVRILFYDQPAFSPVIGVDDGICKRLAYGFMCGSFSLRGQVVI